MQYVIYKSRNGTQKVAHVIGRHLDTYSRAWVTLESDDESIETVLETEILTRLPEENDQIGGLDYGGGV